MFNFDVVTLHDGTQIESESFQSLWTSLKMVETTDDEALLDLIEKCHDAKDGINTSGRESPKILKERQLINEDETVPLPVQKIVFNSVQGTGYWTELTSPLAEKAVSVITVN